MSLLLRSVLQQLLSRCTHLLQTVTHKLSRSKSVLIITSLQATSSAFSVCGLQQGRWEATRALFDQQQKDPSLSLKFNLVKTGPKWGWMNTHNQSGGRPGIISEGHITFCFAHTDHSIILLPVLTGSTDGAEDPVSHHLL